MTLAKQDKTLQICIGIFLCLNIMAWFWARDMQVSWGNVPPAPKQEYASSIGLGDKSFAYRINSLMVQNLGDTGGRVTSLEDYDYERLVEWFYLQDSLDEKSSFIPYLASHLFGAVQQPEKYRPIIGYLKQAGERDYQENWRWLVQAIYYARFRLNDIDLALELAYKLADNENKNRPAWTSQMPAFVLTQKGEKEAAYSLMLEMLKSSADKLHPNEVYNTKIFMCTRLISKEDAMLNPLCDGIILK